MQMLIRSQIALTEAMQKTNVRMAETSEKLNALISLMDQHLGDHQSGRA